MVLGKIPRAKNLEIKTALLDYLNQGPAASFPTDLDRS
jgi:hypothetical protein